MKKCLPYLVVFSLIISFLACAKPPVMMERVIVKNATNSKITAVKVRHEPTKKFGAVNAILPDEALEIGLSSKGKPILGEQALISWRDGGGLEWNVALDIPYDLSVAKSKRPVRLVYIIYSSGRATVHLREL
jgi:hypothetical protein